MNDSLKSFLTFGLLVACAPFTQTAVSADKIILEHADTLRSTSGERQLIGNVRVRHRDSRIRANRAVFYTERGMIDLIGKVKLIEPGRTLTADRITYWENSGDYDAAGSVDMTLEDSVRVRCEVAKYLDLYGTVELFRNVQIDVLSDNSRITGMNGRWVKGEDVGVVGGNPVYTLPDVGTDPPETLRIVSKKIEYFQKTRAARFTGEVQLDKGDLTAVADSLFHHPDSNYTELSGASTIWRSPDKLSGHRITMTYDKKDLKRMDVTGEAVILSEVDFDPDQRNRLAGDRIHIQVVNDSTRSVRVEGDSEGDYYVWGDDEVFHGVNLAVADAIELTIVNDRTERILMQGGCSGAFYPPRFVPPELRSRGEMP